MNSKILIGILSGTTIYFAIKGFRIDKKYQKDSKQFGEAILYLLQFCRSKGIEIEEFDAIILYDLLDLHEINEND